MVYCRHKRSHHDLRHEIEKVIMEQNWPPGLMPNGPQLQSAGQHHLVAAIRQMGGFRTIAAKIGLTPGPSDNRGRPKKAEADLGLVTTSAQETEQVVTARSEMRMIEAAVNLLHRADTADRELQACRTSSVKLGS